MTQIQPGKAKDPISDIMETIEHIKRLGGKRYLPITRDITNWKGIQIEIDLTTSYLSKPPKYRVFASNPELKHLFPQREMTWDEWLNQYKSPQAKSKINDESLPI